MNRRGRQAKSEARRRTDTICALATPPGVGSIAVIRVSGPETFAVLDRIFSGPKPSRRPSHTVRLGWLRDRDGHPIDQVMLTVFRGPRSYTGEHMAEISCHGGTLIADAALALLRELGCRQAEPGEFARRAVLSGKLTLSQAEAVLDLINARSPAALRGALDRYQGSLSKLVLGLTEELRGICASAEYHLGFDESNASRPGMTSGIRRLIRQFDSVIEQGERSRHLNEGAKVAIIGRPNVGKSSLFNRLLQEERALVTAEPGTTRDRVEATTFLNDVPVTLTDTAGLFCGAGHNPAASDAVPIASAQLGLCPKPAGHPPKPKEPGITSLAAEQTLTALTRADLILAVFDGSEPVRKADHEVFAAVSTRPAIYVVNKADKPRWREPEFLNGHPRVKVSARTGANVGRLRSAIARRFRIRDTAAVAGTRHLELFRESRAALKRSLSAPDAETAALELRAALASLDLIDAPASDTEILDRVFARFCVGK